MERFIAVILFSLLFTSMVLATHNGLLRGENRHLKDQLQTANDQLALVQTIKCEGVLEAPRIGK